LRNSIGPRICCLTRGERRQRVSLTVLTARQTTAANCTVFCGKHFS
jgi:hypothetical protein